MSFEYWMLPSSNDKKTRIVRGYKSGKYLVFARDDSKQCKYDLSSGEVIGFSGRKVKTLASQLKDLTVGRMIEILDDPNYKQYCKYIWKRRHNGKAWVFLHYTLPNYKDFEQYFTSGITNLQGSLLYGFNRLPKGLIKLLKEHPDVQMTNKLYECYERNTQAFNVLDHMSLKNTTYQKMIELMTYGMTRTVQRGSAVNRNDLTLRMGDGGATIPRRVLVTQSDYFTELVRNYGYGEKLLLEYIDAQMQKRRSSRFCQDIYDYADMMTRMHPDFDRYPKDFKKAHRKAVKDFNRLVFNFNEEEYRKRNVLDYECEIDGFLFIYPKKASEIQQEGKDQHNCVATYIDRVLREDCHIMFMRPKDKPEESYITLEIRNNYIVQAKRKYNRDPSPEEEKVIEKWNEKYATYDINKSLIGGKVCVNI